MNFAPAVLKAGNVVKVSDPCRHTLSPFVFPQQWFRNGVQSRHNHHSAAIIGVCVVNT